MSGGYCPRCSQPLPPGAGSCPACGQLIARPAGDRGQKWIVIALVGAGCAVVGLFLAGIVAAIFIPNFLDATQKAKQKRTASDMRALGAALEAYGAQSEGRYPDATTASALVAQLAGHGYQGGSADGWKRELRWTCLDPTEGGCSSYELASSGRDGTFEQQPGGYEEGAFTGTEYDADLVLADGLFVRWPDWHGRYGAPGEPAADDD
jgi:hypothetical protein